MPANPLIPTHAASTAFPAGDPPFSPCVVGGKESELESATITIVWKSSADWLSISADAVSVKEDVAIANASAIERVDRMTTFNSFLDEDLFEVSRVL